MLSNDRGQPVPAGQLFAASRVVDLILTGMRNGKAISPIGD